jgi:hypothetical protein
MPRYGVGNAKVTPISTAGTTTLNPGQGANTEIVGQFGVLYGVNVQSVGTSFAVSLYDVKLPNGLGTNTATSTKTICTCTASAVGQSVSAGVGDVGARYGGALVAVASGTGGQFNVLWD